MRNKETSIDNFKTIFFYLAYKLVKWNVYPMYLKGDVSAYMDSPVASSQNMTR